MQSNEVNSSYFSHMHLKNRILVMMKYTKLVTISMLLEFNCVVPTEIN